MKDSTAFHYFRVSVMLVFVISPCFLFGQLGADLSSTDNTKCDGSPCNYNGPSILINELMMSPNNNDGSLWGSNTGQRGEWIELYNPNICESIDISCFYLGNNTNDGGEHAGGYVIPSGTVVPPAGFALIRGLNAAPVPAALLVENGGNVVELVVDGTGVCIDGGSRLWFPNVGGWFAFYDNNGVPQDAVSWANQSNIDKNPCVPTLAGCGYSGSLSSYNDFPNSRKNYILNVDASDHQGQSIRRIPDGGVWSGPGTPTYAVCNSTCIDPQSINCNGTATAMPQGGTPPYTYHWDDPQEQTTQTADRLCAGSYCVTITDALGNTAVQCITVEDVSYAIQISDAICEGESYTLPDNTTVTAAGEYPVLLHTGNGCDSTITVDLEVYPKYAIELNPQICASQTYTLPDGSEVDQTGTYQFAFQTVHGCDSIYTVNLTVSSPIQITVDAQICAGDDYQLPDGSVVSDEGLYQVTVAGDPALCDTLFSVNLAFRPDIQIGFTDFNSVSCYGDTDGSVTLDITGTGAPYTYAWSDSTDHGLQALGLEPGGYAVEVTDIFGCKADTSFQIDEPTPVSITASADTLICLGSQSELIAGASGGTGDFEYHWSHTATLDSNSTVSPGQDAEYQVFATDENGCKTDTIALDVAVINLYSDSLEVSPGDSICAGGSAVLTASYQGEYPPYAFIWSAGVPDDLGPIMVSPDSTTLYTVTVNDGCGNEVSKDIEIVVWSLPVAVLDSVADVSCYGMGDGAAEISVSEGTPEYSFNWSDGQDHGSNAEGLDPATYTVQISDTHGCETEIAFDIAQPQPLDITLSGDTLICPGEEIELRTGIRGGTPGISYHWNHTNDNTDSVSVNPVADTTYSVYAEDANGCTTDPLEIAVRVMNMDPGLLTVSNDTAVCPGQMASVFGSYTGSFPPYQYTWTEGLDEGQGPYYVSPAEPTNYTLSVSDICGNMLSATVLVDLYETPEAVLPDELFAGCSPLQLNLVDSMNTDPGFTHEWLISGAGSYFGNPANLSLENSGTYNISLMVTSPDGCTALTETTIPAEVYPLPNADFTASRWTTGLDEPEVTFNDISTGALFSIWEIENTLFEDQPELVYTFSDTGYYAVQLVVENEFGCRDSLTKWVTITIDHTVEIPNAFTPTDPGDNSNYDPGSTSNTVFYPFSEYVSDYHMSVFNRWGELIFESTEVEKGWNGTYHEKPCPQDVYVYKIDLTYLDGKKITRVGDVTLLR